MIIIDIKYRYICLMIRLYVLFIFCYNLGSQFVEPLINIYIPLEMMMSTKIENFLYK